MRKIFNFISAGIVTLMSAAGCSLSSQAQDVEYGDFIFELSRYNGNPRYEAAITGVRPGHALSGEVVLPATVTVDDETYDVIGLGLSNYSSHDGDDPAIGYNEKITSVVIPSSIRFIGKYEFMGCPNITEYKVAQGNKYFVVENGILYKDTRYSDTEQIWELFRYPSARQGAVFAIPEKAAYIGTGAFAANRYVKKLYMSGKQRLCDCWQLGNKSIESIDCTAVAYYNEKEPGVIYWGNLLDCVCPGLELDTFTVPDGQYSLSDGTFCNSSIQHIIIPEETERPCSNYTFAFSDVESVTFKGNPPFVVGSGCFLRCKNLKHIDLGSSDANHISIYSTAFFGCSALETLTLNENAKTIELGSQAFQDCRALTAFPLTSKMTIPKLPEKVFSGCAALEAFSLAGVKEIEYLGYQFEGTGLTTVNWPSAENEVPQGCFKNCKQLTKVNLKSTTKQLSWDAFAGSSITAISMMGVEWFPGSAFDNCENLSRVYFPKAADETAFYYYNEIEFIPESCEVIVNNSLLNELADQDRIGGENVKLYLSSFTARSDLGNSWQAIYVPGGAGSIYEAVTSAPVREMYSYTTDKRGSSVKIGSTAAGVRITGVIIEGVEAMLTDGVWHAEVQPSESSKMNVEVKYTVYGNPMQTVYEYPNEKNNAIKTIDGAEEISITRQESDRILLSADANWVLITPAGQVARQGKSSEISLTDLSAGIYILNVTDAPQLTLKIQL